MLILFAQHASIKTSGVLGSLAMCTRAVVAVMALMLALQVLGGEGAGKRKKGPGQAIALSERDWERWLTYILNHHSCHLYALVWLTGAFALRCMEAASLRGEDFRLDANPPFVRIEPTPGASKSPGDRCGC